MRAIECEATKLELRSSAMELYEKAAKHGHPEAMFQLARMYHYLLRDTVKGHAYCIDAANKGHVKAQIFLGQFSCDTS